MKKIIIYIILVIFAIVGCENVVQKEENHATTLDGITVTVTNPAGSIVYREYNKIGEKSNEKMECLPFPGNYGHVTVPANDGTPEKQIPTLVMSPAVSNGATIVINPVAVLKMKEYEEDFSVIIAVPADSSQLTIQPKNFSDFAVRYAATKQIIEKWFLNSKEVGQISVVGWSDERVGEAMLK